MKKIIINILKWIWYLLLIVGSFGLIIALIGLVFKNDSIYFWGLLLSSPFYLVVLPLCLLLMFIGSVYGIVREPRSALRKKTRTVKTEKKWIIVWQKSDSNYVRYFITALPIQTI